MKNITLYLRTVVKVTDNQKLEKLLLPISDLENNLSAVCEALAEENEEELQLQRS